MPSVAQPSGTERSDRVRTYGEVAVTVQRVRVALEERGYKCGPGSALGFLFNRAQVLVKQWDGKTDQHDILTLMQADDAERIGTAVEEVLDDPEAAEAIKRITRSDMHLATRRPSQGKDALWELDLLSYLRRNALPARLQEPPDLVAMLPGLLGDYGFACKKVYSEGSVKSQLRKGCHQLRAMGGSGVVAFNLDDITPERSILVQPTRQVANDVLHRRNLAFLGRHLLYFQDAVLKGQCDGILLGTTVQADIANMSPRFNRVTQLTLWTVNEAEPGAHMRIGALRRLLPQDPA